MYLLGAGQSHQSGNCFGISSDTQKKNKVFFLFMSPTVLQSHHFPRFGKDYVGKFTEGQTEA